MDRSHRSKLLREAVEHPDRLLSRKKFWRLELFPYFLRRCDDILYDDPHAGLAVTKYAPQYAAKVAEANPGTNGADLMLLAHSHVGSAYRRTDDFGCADDAFRAAEPYKDSASPKALAEYLRRLAYLRLCQHDAECFEVIGEAIAIHKRGNLVHRHELGECLLCRGHAYFEFKQPGKSLEDLSAALNHISIKIDDKTWYCALLTLAVWAVEYGTDQQLETALENLKPAMAILNTFKGRPVFKLKLRWLIALVDARLGAVGSAEITYLEVRNRLVDMKLGYEVGMLQVDLALLYLAQGRHAELQALVRETAAIFRRIGVEAKAQQTFDVWRQAEQVDEDLLKRIRGMFAAEAMSNSAISAA